MVVARMPSHRFYFQGCALPSAHYFATPLGNIPIDTQAIEQLQKIEDVDYKPILLLDEESKILREAQKNIKDYYALIEIHYDVLRRVVDSRKRIYRLNKYTKFKDLETNYSESDAF